MSKTDDQGRREFLKGSAAAMLVASCWGWPNAVASAEDPARSHGMVVVGEQTVFLSHLPLFERPHNFQVILEATFTKPGSDPQADYVADRKRKRVNPYTLEPEAFVLPKLAASPPLRSFKASIYRGHFEKLKDRKLDAARIGEDVQVTVTRVVHFRRFDPAAAKPAQLEYLLFGKGGELFLAHLITRPPDFDQILSVKIPNQTFTDEELGQGVSVVIPGRPNSVSKRIMGTGAVTAQIKAAGGGAPKTLKLQPGTELYSEQGEELSS